MSGLLLCIDTAGSRCAVGLHDMASGTLLAHAEPDIGRGHAELLMDLLAEVLAQAGATYADLRKIAVVVGPGSFTGLRVGVAAARGLSLALAIPAVAVSTLEALAEPHWNAEARVLAVIDAKRGEIYAALYGTGGAVLREPTAIDPSILDAFVEGAGDDAAPLALVGSGAAIAVASLSRATVARPEGTSEPAIASVARIGAIRLPAGAPMPLYLRGADAKPQAPTGISHDRGQATLP